MDFEGNAERIIESIRIAKKRGATFRTGPELEITYPSFNLQMVDLIADMAVWTIFWRTTHTYIPGKCFAVSFHTKIAKTYCSISECTEIWYCPDLNRPVRHRSVYYNCRVIVYNKYIHLIRPKIWLANDGNYRERRYFQCWREPRYMETHEIPVSGWPLLASGQVDCFIYRSDQQ